MQQTDQPLSGSMWLRRFMWVCVAIGVISSVVAHNWASFVWCLSCAIWWRYACALEDDLPN